MSVGVVERDYLVTVSTNAGPGSIGMYAKRTWNGANQSTPAPPYEEHNYVMSDQAWRDSIIRFSYTPTGQVYTGTYRNMGGNPSMANPWLTADDFALLQGLASKVRRTEFNAAVTTAEGLQTLKYLGDSTHRLADGFGHLSKGDVRRAAYAWRAKRPRRVHEDIASNYLEMQYAIRPLLNDIRFAAEAVADVMGKPFRQSVRVSRKKLTSSGTMSFLTPIGTRLVRKGLIVRFQEDISLMQQMGLLDPDLVLWEKLPYSFVADWVYPIGAWLETRGTLSALRRATFIESILDHTGISGVKVGPGAGGFTLREEGTFNWFQTNFERKITLGPPTLPYPPRRPLSSVASWSHAASGVALVVQRFSGRKVSFLKR